jgi:hypothetical protein
MIKFVGDINFADGYFDLGFGVGTLLKKGENPFSEIKNDVNDILIGNFECVCSNRSIRKGSENNFFRVSPDILKCANNVNIYGIANNHIMQHGSEAYYDTLSFIENNSSVYIGDIKKKYYEFQHNGHSIGIVNFSYRHENFSTNPLYWYLPEISELNEIFKRIENNDLRVAYIHWGYEYMNYPSFEQQLFGRFLIDMGFNLVVGMHSHILQGFEKYKNGFIFYSLGNFIFKMGNEDCKRSIILKVDLDSEKNIIIDFDYIYLNQKGFPIIQDFYSVPTKYTFEFLNQKLKSISHEKYFNEVSRTINRNRLSNYKLIIQSLFKYKLSDILQIIFSFVKRRIKW